MPIIPGLAVMPSVLGNTFLSLLQDRTYPVRSNDSLAVICPMYNEEKGAAQALASLLEQDSLPDHIVASINGGIDATYEVVSKLLMDRGFTQSSFDALPDIGAGLEEWHSTEYDLRLSIAVYSRKVSKSESINNLVQHGVSADRILVMDGDTILHPGFVRALRDNFYRLRVRRIGKRKSFILEDFALQSGAVTSFAPPEAKRVQRFISAGREAEYAFSGVLREGQSKLIGRSELFGNSRLYTVIGCGFTARRDMFPMPTDTETEDHDFTLACQTKQTKVSQINRLDLRRRGFRIVVKGRELNPEHFFDAQDSIILRCSGNARYVRTALMGTEDPPHFNGFVRQIERWNGGGQQNALKRLRKRLPINVGFIVWSSLIENMLGIALLAMLPLLLALNIGNPSLGIAPRALGIWFGLDAFLTMMLVTYGFYRLRRAEGANRPIAFLHSFLSSFRTTLPFLVLRYINPFTYVASATRVIPEYLFQNRKSVVKNTGVVWERASVRRRTRTGTVFAWNAALLAISAVAVANIAPRLNPVNQEAWRLTYQRTALDMRDFDYLPFMATENPRPQSVVSLTANQDTLSKFCDPSFTKMASQLPRSFEGDASAYVYKGRWHLRTLARLAPLIPYIERASTAYDIPPSLLIKIFLNESDLDPLAIGPTDDKGLSQVTSDALTLLKGLSKDESNEFYNPYLIPETFSVFNPDFSVCAGAAKISWALRQPGVDNELEAYALYINPIDGLKHGKISEKHQVLTSQLINLEDMTQTLANTLAAYRQMPEKLTQTERDLLAVSDRIVSEHLGLEEAYRATYTIVEAQDISDKDMFQRFLTSYFGEAGSSKLAQN
jgi:cellulose synthase/poly-beta-1,6-N-acetylglucosamine synthase-like glycosyltransferase